MMNSSASRRIFRSPEGEGDVFVVGTPLRQQVAADDPVTSVTSLLDGAKRRAAAILAQAETDAAAIVERAEAEVATARAAGFEAGITAGMSGASGEASAHLEIIRTAAAEGIAIRDAMIDEAMPAMARAVAMACRRVVGAAFAADPSLTAAACIDAVRTAAGQQIISIRVSPGALDTVRADLADLADFVQPDEGIELGGCIIDLRNGTIDATLDSRLALMEIALLSAGGAAA
jgi:flagellar biosynthesis/type III secretory pathway protein FliH